MAPRARRRAATGRRSRVARGRALGSRSRSRGAAKRPRLRRLGARPAHTRSASPRARNARREPGWRSRGVSRSWSARHAVLQQSPQAPETEPQAALYGTEGELQRARDLLVREAGEERQFDGLALIGGQGRERALDLLAIELLGGQSPDVGRPRIGTQLVGQRGDGGAPPQAVDGAVVDYAQQPAPH